MLTLGYINYTTRLAGLPLCCCCSSAAGAAHLPPVALRLQLRLRDNLAVRTKQFSTSPMRAAFGRSSPPAGYIYGLKPTGHNAVF